MKEKYYMVKKRTYTKKEKANFVFIKISEGKLESIAGDETLFSLLELENGEPRIKGKTAGEYEFQPLTDNIYLGGDN